MEKIDLLLLEDNATDAELTIKVLRRQHIAENIVHVKDGAEAIDFVFCKGKYTSREKILPSLIVLDLKVPKVFGIEVLEILKSNPLTNHIPVVVLSSSSLDSDKDACYNLGANAYIVKPIGFDDFTETISQLGHYITQSNLPPNDK